MRFTMMDLIDTIIRTNICKYMYVIHTAVLQFEFRNELAPPKIYSPTRIAPGYIYRAVCSTARKTDISSVRTVG